MIKNISSDRFLLKKSDFKDLFKIMKICLIFLFAFTFQLMALNINAQDATIELKKNSVTVNQLINEIEKQTDYLVVYSNREVNTNRIITFQRKSDKVSEYLNEAFANTDIGYDFENNYIVLSKKAQQTTNILTNLEQTAQQQGKTVKGTVTDSNGEPVIGATVIVQGDASKGTVTDIDGNFTLSGIPEDAVLLFSYVGMKALEVSLKGRSNVLVVMESDSEMLEELVVVGYGTVKKANLTGAVGQADPKQIENRPIPNIAVGLQGIIPNLNISMSSGVATEVPSFNIRGMTSLTGGTPLIVIDDVPSTVEQLMKLNPSDIENISTLMDAASAAIYGARAAFGVVLVTTKNAQKEKLIVTVGSNVSFRRPITIPQFVTEPDTVVSLRVLGSGLWYSVKDIYGSNDMDYLHAVARGEADPIRLNPEQPDRWQYAGSTDWFKEAAKKHAISQNHNFSISGKEKKVNYYFSGAFNRQGGLFKIAKEDFDRYNLRFKINYNLTPWLVLSNNSGFSYDIYDESSRRIDVQTLFETPTFDMIKNPDGSWTARGASVFGAIKDGGRRVSKNNNFNTTFTAKATLYKDLVFTGKASFLKASYDMSAFWIPIPYKLGPDHVEIYRPLKEAQREAQSKSQNVFDLYFDYDKEIGKHKVHCLAGYNQEYYYNNWFWASNKDLISENVPSINLATGDPLVGENIDDWATRSVFYRLNYNFDNKYLFEFNGRYDGTSRFPSNKRFCFFPSISAGWNLSKEEFFKPLSSYVNYLKPRISYGNLGNQDVSSYFYLPSMYSGKTEAIIYGGNKLDQLTTVYAPGLVSPNLTWETVSTINYGVDMGFLQNRLSATFDYYHRNTYDMLTPGKTLPAVLGTSSPKMNAADLITKGWELTVSWRNEAKILKSPFNYSVKAILSDSRAWITKYDNPDGKLSDYYVGYEIGTIFGFVSNELFQSPDELKNHANQGMLWTYPDKVPPGPGDIKIEDLNGDGVIRTGNTIYDLQDQKIIGNSSPRYRTSFMFDCNWKGFDLSLFVQGILKGDYYPGDTYFWSVYQTPWMNVTKWHLDNMWTPENTDAYMPRLKGYAASWWGGGELIRANTRYLQKRTYMRLKNASLGYSLPESLIQNVNISGIRFYVSGENLFTWTAFENKNCDPETLAKYPLQKTFLFGVNFTF